MAETNPKYKDVFPVKPAVPTVEGDVPTTRRVLTGLWSLDTALAGADGTPGVPVRGGLELYGKWETGKSTLAYYLAGRVQPTGKVVLVDLEGGARKDYLSSALGQSGFSGTIYRVAHEDSKGDPRSHEAMLKEGADALLEDEVRCLVLDSAAMTQPKVEREGEIEKAYMGKRAQVLAKFSRRWGPWINYAKDDKLVIIVNHMLQSMDGFGKMSPGGDTLKFGIHARLWIKRSDTLQNTGGCFEAEIMVEKLRFGGKHEDRKARVLIIPGIGVSPELTALFDCMSFKKGQEHLYAKRPGGMVQYRFNVEDEWTKVAQLTTLIKRLKKGDRSDFTPFYRILEEREI